MVLQAVYFFYFIQIRDGTVYGSRSDYRSRPHCHSATSHIVSVHTLVDLATEFYYSRLELDGSCIHLRHESLRLELN